MGRFALLLALALSACAVPQKLQTVTITRTEAVLPPPTLYSIDGGCQHAPARSTGTVRDLATVLIDERSGMDQCLGDRAALRQWVRDNGK